MRGRCAGRRRSSDSYSETNTGSLKDEEESTSLATPSALYDFSNSARTFSYSWTLTDSEGLQSGCRALSQKVSSNSQHDEMDSGLVKKFPSESQLSKYPCIGSMTDDRSTLVNPTLLDASETSGKLGETWPKQRQHNLKYFQVYSLRDSSGHEERKETMFSTAGSTSNSSR